jgi:archaemetzincin
MANIGSHEIGHMFTMAHCINAQCTMNGSNTLYETDLQPNRLCSQCQQKLFWNIQYENKKRLNQLIQFFVKYHLTRDLKLAEKDLERMQEGE